MRARSGGEGAKRLRAKPAPAINGKTKPARIIEIG